MRRGAAAAALALALAAVQCKDEPTGPTSGSLSIHLSNAGSSDRAMLLQLAGTDTTARIDTVLAPSGSGYRVFVQRQTSTRWRVIVAGNLSNGALLTIGVPDKSRTLAYTGSILDVADVSFAAVPPGSRALTVAP